MPASQQTRPSPPPVYVSHSHAPFTLDPRFDFAAHDESSLSNQHHSRQRFQPAMHNGWSSTFSHVMTEPTPPHLSGNAGRNDNYYTGIGVPTGSLTLSSMPQRTSSDGLFYDSACSTPALVPSDTFGAGPYTSHPNSSAESLNPDSGAPRFPQRAASVKRENNYAIPPAVQATAMPAPRRVPGACTRCRRLKMKCEFKDGAYDCSRCTHGGHECIFEERKPKAPGKREQMKQLMKIAEERLDAQITQAKKESPHYTPLTFVHQHTTLSDAQKDTYKTVLAHASAAKKPLPSQLEDVRTLLENEDLSSLDGSEGTSSESSEGSPYATTQELPNRRAPIGIMAEMSFAHQDGPSYFQSGPLANHTLRQLMIKRGDLAPQILLHGLITSVEEVELLFKIFFKHIQPIVAILDEKIHTPAAVLLRSPFLFTVILVVASRFLRLEPGRENQDIYPIAIHYAKTAAASALLDGRRTVETVQAFLLLGLYAPGAKHLEDSKTWSFAGVARMMAADLNFHCLPPRPATEDERTIREWNNKVRTWMVCFNVDRTLASQYGKPCLLQEDAHVRNVDWYKTSIHNNPYDLHLQAHTALLSIMKRFHATIAEVPETEPVESLIKIIESFDEELATFKEDLDEKYRLESDAADEGCRFRTSLNPLTINYSRLVVLSRILEKNFPRSPALQDLVSKAFVAATTLIETFTGPLLASKQLTYAPDCYFVYAGFAATFLLKLIDPESTTRVDDQEQKEIIVSRVGKLAEVLNGLALDDTHVAGVYAQLIASTLRRIIQPVELMGSDASSPASTISSVTTGGFSTEAAMGTSSHPFLEFEFDTEPFSLDPMTTDVLLTPPAVDVHGAGMTEFFPAQQGIGSWSTYTPVEPWNHQDMYHMPPQSYSQHPASFDFYPFNASQTQF